MAAWLSYCPVCVTKRRDGIPNNITPVTKFENQTNIGGWEPVDGAHKAAFGGDGLVLDAASQQSPADGGSTPPASTRKGRPKKYASRAEQQRAYRERHGS